MHRRKKSPRTAKKKHRASGVIAMTGAGETSTGAMTAGIREAAAAAVEVAVGIFVSNSVAAAAVVEIATVTGAVVAVGAVTSVRVNCHSLRKASA